jgi:CubicO group peptidase (beta-lactamase class C family)
MFMRRTRAVLLFLLFAATAMAALPPAAGGGDTLQDQAARMDAYLAAAHKLGRWSGSVLVARGGRIILSRGYGMANYELDVPNTPATKFRLGSVTKQFTAMAVLQLVEKGKLKVTDTIRAIFPDYPPTGDRVTIHHLLTHTSGVPNMTELPDYVKTMTLPSTAWQTIDKFKNLPLDFAPGEKFSYSNSNYVLLGAVIEKLAGEPYENYLREYVFKVAGMEDSGYDHHETVLKNRASGYEFPGDTIANAPYVDMSIPFAAGGLYSTVEDLYKWDRALYTEKLLSKAGLARMFTPFKGGYAYGWMTGEFAGHKNIRHGGGINGFITDISRFPDDDACVIVLSNYITGYIQETSDALAGILFGREVEIPKEKSFIKLPAAALDAYKGKYKLEDSQVVFTVTHEGEGLYIQVAGQPRTSLLAESETKFFMRNLGFWVTFVKDGSGRVTHFVLLQGKRETKAIRAE